ncbi:MAG: glycosyltransferase family 1 protein [Patescibacteria group bacterium]|jgi:glycosyltransferase involved in cell wall biosynthesis
MRIAVDLRSLTEPLPSGITEYTKQIAFQFARHGTGHDFVLFSNSRKNVSSDIGTLWSGANAEWKVTHWPNKIFNSSIIMTGYPRLDTWVGGTDVFFMPNLNFANFTGACKVVVTVHDLSFLHSGFYSAKGRMWHNAIRPFSILKRANAIVAVSQSTAIDLINRIPSLNGRVTVIHSGVDEKYFISDVHDCDRVRAKYSLPSKYILFLGTAENRKNLLGLVQAWRKLKKRSRTIPSLVIAGKPQQFNHFGDPDIIFLGYVPETDKAGLYGNALVFCYPSFFEGFGLPILEAMACGTPVIASYATSLAEVVGTAGIMVNPYSVAEMSHALNMLLSDDTMRVSLGERGRLRARQFTWESTGQKTLNLLTNI